MVCHHGFDNHALPVIYKNVSVNAALKPEHGPKCLHAMHNLGVFLAPSLCDAVGLMQFGDQPHCIHYLTHPAFTLSEMKLRISSMSLQSWSCSSTVCLPDSEARLRLM